MTKQEFIKNHIDHVFGGAPYKRLLADLDALIASEIEAHEQSQWKPYPNNKPKLQGTYTCTLRDGSIAFVYWDGIGFDTTLVIAFQYDPKPYQP